MSSFSSSFWEESKYEKLNEREREREDMYIYIYIHAFFAHTISSIFTASSFTVCQPNENFSLRQVNCTVDRKILFSHYFSRTRKFTLFFEACSVFRRKKGDDQRLINIRLTIRSSIHQVESKVWYRGALLVKFWEKRKKLIPRYKLLFKVVLVSWSRTQEDFRSRVYITLLLEVIDAAGASLIPFARDKDFNI